MLTQSLVKDLFIYNHKTGELIWNDGTYKHGRIAGSKDSSGYLVTRIGNKVYKNHRIIWLYIKGYMPENSIDHINHVKDDNRFVNLREVSNVCNARNSKQRENTTSLIKGISWYKLYQKWHVQIHAFGKHKNLGYFQDFDEAVAHRLAAEQCLNWNQCDSDSPAFNHMKTVIVNRNFNG